MKDMIKILCFGDSITKGYYCYGTEYYPYSKYLKEEFSKNYQYLKFEIVEYGK